MMTISLPYAPSANRMWRTVMVRGHPIMVPTSDAKKYKRVVAQLAVASGLRRPIEGPVGVDIVLHPKEPQDAAKRLRKEGPMWHLNVRCLDVDNCVKVTLDALQGVAYVNDDQVLALVVNRGMPTPNGALVVSVSSLDAEQSFPAPPQIAIPFDDDDPFAEAA